MDKIILLGGSPTAGKTYAAKKLAHALKLPWISTDKIRSQMRKTVNRSDHPRLFEFAEATPKMAVDYLSTKSAQQIVKDQNAESLDVWKGVRDKIENDSTGSFIIEVVAILPCLVSRLHVKNKKIKAVFLVDDNIQRVRRTIYTRGLWAKANEYSDTVKEKEVAWVMAFNEYIIKETKKYGLPLIKIKDRRKYIGQIIKVINK